jgi:hypothetical protein
VSAPLVDGTTVTARAQAAIDFAAEVALLAGAFAEHAGAVPRERAERVKRYYKGPA